MNNLRVIISNKLKTLRAKHNLTQSQMAEKIGVALRTYQNYEAGERTPKANVLNTIQSAFDLKESLFSEYILDENDQPNGLHRAAELIAKFSQLSAKNQSLILKSIDLMLKAQYEHPKSKVV